jgi:hypothetical protein
MGVLEVSLFSTPTADKLTRTQLVEHLQARTLFHQNNMNQCVTTLDESEVNVKFQQLHNTLHFPIHCAVQSALVRQMKKVNMQIQIYLNIKEEEILNNLSFYASPYILFIFPLLSHLVVFLRLPVRLNIAKIYVLQ